MFLVDMNFNDMSKITPELTDLHRNYLAKEYKANNLMFGGRKEPRTGGIIISKHSNKGELVSLLESDPFVQAGAASYFITEFIPVMASEAYEAVLAS